MTRTTVVRPRSLVLGDRVFRDYKACLVVEDGSIESLHQKDGPGVPRDAEVLEIDGTLMPGLVDIQVNGAGGRSVDEGTPEALATVAAAVGAGGAAAYLPTIITAPWDDLLQQVERAAQWLAEFKPGPTDAVPLGLHIEGPFLEVSGAHDESCFVDPTPERVDALIDAGRGRVAHVTMAPGRHGAPAAVRQFRESGVAVSFGHARSTEQFAACTDAGARGVTHLFNAMSPLHHRDPGIVGHALDDERLFCALILDGAHMHPIAARIAWRVLGPARTLLVTDAVSAAGMPDGEFTLSGMRVNLRDGVVRDDAGNLAGSALTMEQAARGFFSMIPAANATALARIASTNPATLLGRAGSWGTTGAGGVARFTVLEADGGLRMLAVD